MVCGGVRRGVLSVLWIVFYSIFSRLFFPVFPVEAVCSQLVALGS